MQSFLLSFDIVMILRDVNSNFKFTQGFSKDSKPRF